MTPLRGVHYSRVSDPSQVSGASLDQQVAHGVEWFGRKGIELVRCFREEGESGRSAKRSTLTLALAFIAAEVKAGRKIDLFVIHDLSRFFRNLEEQWELKKKLAALGTRIDSVAMPITEDAHGRAMQNFMGTSNQFLVELNAEKIRDCMLARKRQGRWPHPAPIGYLNRKTDDGSRKWIEIDPERGPLLRGAFEAVARGEGITEALAAVTRRGLRSKKGRQLRVQEFRDLLVNPFYVGRIRSVKYGFEVEGEHPALVEAATFARVGDRLAGRGAQVPHVQVREEFPLRGFIRCEACGKPLTADLARGRHGKLYGYYRCWVPGCRAVTLAAGKVEQALVDDLNTRRLSPGAADLLVATLQAVLAEEDAAAEKDRARGNQHLLELRRRRDRVIDAYLHEGALDRPQYDEQMRRLNREIEETSAAYFEPRKNGPAGSRTEQLLTFAKPMLTGPAALWLAGDAPARRQIQTLVYPQGLTLSKTALRTPEVAFVFNVLGEENSMKVEMVEHCRAGSNPLRDWFEKAAAVVQAVLAPPQIAWGRA